MYYIWRFPADIVNSREGRSQVEAIPPGKILVEEFEWDERNEEHCGRHDLDPLIAEEVKDGAPKFYPNKPDVTGSHMMIGPDDEGEFWTVILVRVRNGLWRPITGWESGSKEIGLYKST